MRAVFIGTGPLLGHALDSIGVTSTLLLLLAIFGPLIALVLIPLVVRIRREEAESKASIAPAA